MWNSMICCSQCLCSLAVHIVYLQQQSHNCCILTANPLCLGLDHWHKLLLLAKLATFLPQQLHSTAFKTLGVWVHSFCVLSSPNWESNLTELLYWNRILILLVSWTNCPCEGGSTIIVFSSGVCPFLQKILDSLIISTTTCKVKRCCLQHRGKVGEWIEKWWGTANKHKLEVERHASETAWRKGLTIKV